MGIHLGLELFAGLERIPVGRSARLGYRWLQVVFGPVNHFAGTRILPLKGCAASGFQAILPAVRQAVLGKGADGMSGSRNRPMTC